MAAAGVVSNYLSEFFIQHFLMQIFDLLCEMKGNTISKDVNKTALNFDQFETNHINVNIRDNTMVDDLFKTNIHYIHTCFFCERCVLFKTIHFMRAGFVLDMYVRQNRQV